MRFLKDRAVIFFALFVPIISLAEEWSKVEIDKRVSRYLESQDYDWVETGKLDFDGDGDLDFLVNPGGDEPEKESDTWEIYFKEGGGYYFSPDGGRLPIFRDNLEFRRIDARGNPKALIWYDSRLGNEGEIMAFWYKKNDNLKWRRRAKAISERHLLSPRKDEMHSSSEDDSWGSRGLSIEELLKNYTKHEAGPNKER